MRELGVRRVFGIPGGAISPLNDALLDVPEIDVVVTRHEAEAAFAACGHAMQTGEVGVVFVTSGPGATNAITGIASAHCDGVPLLVLVGEVPRAVQGKGALQDGSTHSLNILGMVRHVSKAAWEATDAHSLGHLVRRAVTLATSGRRGPVVLTLPLDVQTARTFTTKVAGDETPVRQVPEAAIVDLKTRIERAVRPVILAGNGMRSAAAASALLRLAEHTQIPVITSPKGKGVFPESHPLALGIFGIGGHPSARRYLESGVDLLIALGTSFSDLGTEGWSQELYPSRTLVHIDADGAMLSRNYPADLGIAARAEAVIEPLLACLPAKPVNPGTARYGVEHVSDAGLAGDSKDGRISPPRALWELQRVLPKDTLYAIDSGEHFLFAAHYLELDAPDAFMAMTGLGSMGQSIGVALGAQLAKPSRTTAVIIGDGGMTMIGTQILDAVACGAPLVVVCMNDGALRMCELGHENVYGRTPSYVVPAMDMVAFARSLGAEGVLIERAGDLLAAKERIRGRKGPIVLDVRIDPGAKMAKKDRIASLRGRMEN
ncbi:MAG: thiamine pyrophosphate-binding protein [Deltaproteobacteria bacterium]|nr:thiamine pyrophosphate-binding protein [Deltaproteobacteria bacterium]